MKRKISIIIVVLLLISINLTYAVGENIFNDLAKLRVLYTNTRITPLLNEIESMENGVLRLINIERNKAGLKSLVASSELSKVALLKSEDMALFDYFDHISPNYGTPFEMMTS